MEPSHQGWKSSARERAAPDNVLQLPRGPQGKQAANTSSPKAQPRQEVAGGLIPFQTEKGIVDLRLVQTSGSQFPKEAVPIDAEFVSVVRAQVGGEGYDFSEQPIIAGTP